MKKILALVLCLLMLVPMIVACGSTEAPVGNDAPAASTAPDPGNDTTNTDPIYIGVPVPLTGPGAEGGLKQKLSAEIAVKQINEAGGVNGRPLELVVLDDAQDATQAATVAQTLCDDERITCVVGHSSSAISAVVQPIYEENKMPNLHPSSSVNTLAEQGYQYWWRNSTRSSTLYPAICAYIVNTMKVKNVAFIYQNAETGTELMKYAKKQEEAGKINIVFDEPFNSGTEVDFTTLITKLMQVEDVDVLWVYMNYNEGGTLLGQMYDMGCNLPVVSDNWLVYQTTIDLAGAEAMENYHSIAYPSPFGTDPITTAYIKEFEKEMGEGNLPNGPAMCTYDAIKIVAQALSEGATKENLAQWCKNIGGHHEGTFTATDLIAGTLTFQKNGDLNDPPYCVIACHDGRFVADGDVDMTGF